MGNGAFMSSMDEARELAASINRVADEAGLKTQVLITDMSQPLAPVAGNALEIAECVDYLQGNRRDARLHEIVVGLGSALLMRSGLVEDETQAKKRVEASLASGEALVRFDRMVAALGGPLGFSENSQTHLPRAPVVREVLSPTAGFVSSIDTRALGLAVVQLGGGRARPEDDIDLSVGLDQIARLGRKVEAGDPFCRVHAPSESAANHVCDMIGQAIIVSEEPVALSPTVIEQVR